MIDLDRQCIISAASAIVTRQFGTIRTAVVVIRSHDNTEFASKDHKTAPTISISSQSRFYATVTWSYFVILCPRHATVRFPLLSTILDLASATLCLHPASYRNGAKRIILCAPANKLSATRKSQISYKECTVMFGSRVVQRNAVPVDDHILAVREWHIITL
jgi:hypothetical protein